MRFTAELDYTLKDVRQYWKVHQLFRGKVLYYISWLLIAVAAVIVVSVGAILIVNRLFNSEFVWYYVIMLAFMALYHVVREVRVRGSLRSLAAQGVITLTADDDAVYARAAALSSEYSYQAFMDIARYKGAHYLYIDKRKAMIVPDRCFTRGDPAAFGAFMEEKTGLKIRNIGG